MKNTIQKTRGTELIINVSDIINVVVGSVDKNNPRSIYLKFTAWANTIDFDEKIEYKTIIRKLRKEIKRYLHFNIDTNLFKRDITMVDMDMRESGITDNKPTFMSCEITLFQNNNYLLVSDKIEDEVIKLSKHICGEIYKNDLYFDFFKDKKRAKLKI